MSKSMRPSVACNALSYYIILHLNGLTAPNKEVDSQRYK